MLLFKTQALILTHAYPRMENRQCAWHLHFCGPIDCYIAICTGELIPGGTDVLIDATRIDIETLTLCTIISLFYWQLCRNMMY